LNDEEDNTNPRIYFKIATKNEYLGKIIFELFYDKVPRTCRNFIELSTNQNGYGYKNCKLFRIVPGFCIQSGDFERNDGTGGYSIYGRYFEDESFKLQHDSFGLLSMANSGPNTNGSQFFITLGYHPHLNGKHVVFGKVIKGMDIVKQIEEYGNDDGKPDTTIRIIDSGLYNNID
jgi:cyclophilin family peptidyl-prolyl cis-trans isomerase